MICIDADRVGSSLHVDTPLLECLHDCQKFSIIDGIIQLRWRELSRVETDKVEVASRGELGQDAAQGEVRGIGLDSEGEIRLEVLQNRGCSEGLLQRAEGCIRLQIVTRVPAISAEAGIRSTLFIGERASEHSGPVQIHRSRTGGGRGTAGRGSRCRRNDGTRDEGETRRGKGGRLRVGEGRRRLILLDCNGCGQESREGGRKGSLLP